jgi:hypothetical protein
VIEFWLSPTGAPLSLVRVCACRDVLAKPTVINKKLFDICMVALQCVLAIEPFEWSMDIQKLFSAHEDYIFNDYICLMGNTDRFNRDNR